MEKKNWDIILDERISMATSFRDTREKWETVKYSKSEINKAGKIIAGGQSSGDELQHALDVLNNWRASHAYPLQVIASNLRLNNKNALVVQRLKRLESIMGKLQRFPNMNLYRMQDLGGCRVIVDRLEDVYNAVKKYKTSRIRHLLKKENDYIASPKESGYRSYHMIYQFQSDKKETYNKNMLIEIQFRTKIQHMWATAVETMGIYTKSSLKSSIGDKNILKFFSLVSSVFASIEEAERTKSPSRISVEVMDEIRALDAEYNIVSSLSALRVAINHVETKAKNKHYILLLDYERMRLRIQEVDKMEDATEIYNSIERQQDKNIDAVLVSATSFDSLKAAYPNYFTDIGGFVKMMRKILKAE